MPNKAAIARGVGLLVICLSASLASGCAKWREPQSQRMGAGPSSSQESTPPESTPMQPSQRPDDQPPAEMTQPSELR